MTKADNLTAQTQPMIVTLPAAIDMAVAPAVTAQLATAVTAGGGLVIADLTWTEFIDSSGAGALFHAHRDAAAAGTELRFAIPHEGVLRILDLLGLAGKLHVYPTVDAALAAGPPASPSGT